MANLTNIEKLNLERLFEMGGGYVLDFSNRTFQEFVLGSTGLDIYDEKYSYASGSKANRLRAFWSKESNYIVAKLLDDLLEYYQTTQNINRPTMGRESSSYTEYLKIPQRLKQESIVENIDAI